MATKKTKKLSGQPVTTTVAADEKFAKVDANGKVTLIAPGQLRNALMGGLDLNIMTDGVFIMYHDKSDNNPRLAKPYNWAARQDSGEIADGVAVVEGDRILVVAPTETTLPGLLWSSANIDGGASVNNYEEALADFNGRANTDSIISRSTAAAVTATASYCAGFCHQYSRVNVNGHGLTAGKWWLPSVGEMMTVFTHLSKINYCLGLINGGQPLAENWYWTSTERSDSLAWTFPLDTCNIAVAWGKKTEFPGRTRPVSAFIR